MRVLSVRSFWLPVLLATLVAAFFGAVLARRGRGLEKLLSDRAVLEARLARLEAENERLRAERDELLSSAQAIERAAREEYGLAAPGESVSDFEPAAPYTGEPSASPTPMSLGERTLTAKNLAFVLPAVVFVISSVVLAVWNLIAAGRDAHVADL